MASFLTESNKQLFTGAALRFFDTLKRQLIIWKEPTKTLISSPTSPWFGYDGQNETNYTFTPSSGVYDAMISPEQTLGVSNIDAPNVSPIDSIQKIIPRTKMRIKVELPCKNFIENGIKNERYEFINNVYNQASFEGLQPFLGLTYYVYILENTK